MSNKIIEFNGTILNGLKAVEIPDHEYVKNRFISIYEQLHKATDGDAFYAREQHHYKKMLNENKALQECTKLSLYAVFIDIAVNGLSLETGNKPLAYVTPRSVNVGTKQQAQWEKRATLVPSPYGELFMRIRAGQIRYADNPVIVYEGDTFVPFLDPSGNKRIEYRAVIPRTSNKIIGSFVKITKKDGTFDFEFLTEQDIDRFRGYSEKNNKRGNEQGKANELYSSNHGQIDPGFLAGKTIKHAFRAYPKIRIAGAATMTEDEIEKEVTSNADIYGIDLENQQAGNVNATNETDDDFSSDEVVTAEAAAPNVNEDGETF